ncbi:MAG TPA: 1-deoxy-D-xylulose-5-phosphate reductoisomerase, partial [Bacteroidales bacterium]|nr:1-deoxy-D-xylulose-5-phosphate reductoisomerase [Bacteroidales bacterium]
MKRRIAILGSTGSIGKQALEVIKLHSDWFSLEVITAHSNADLLIKQAKEFIPNAVVISDETLYTYVKEALSNLPIKVFAGQNAVSQIVSLDTIDIVLVALVGYAGLLPTLKAIEENKIIALANKESLVVAGKLIIEKAKQNNVPIIPVDSEHSAIFQCLVGELN